MTDAQRNVEVNIENYRDFTEDTQKSGVTLDENSVIDISYDGGRLGVTVDGVQVYESKTVGDDFSFTIQNT